MLIVKARAQINMFMCLDLIKGVVILFIGQVY